MHELGLLDEFSNCRIRRFTTSTRKSARCGSPFRTSRPPFRWALCAFMPQWDFLNFLAEKAKRYPNFNLMMNT